MKEPSAPVQKNTNPPTPTPLTRPQSVPTSSRESQNPSQSRDSRTQPHEDVSTSEYQNITFCKPCKIDFATPVSLDKHIDTRHVNDVRNICHLCGICFRNGHNLRMHNQVRHPLKIKDKSMRSEQKRRSRVATKEYEYDVPVSNRFDALNQGNWRRGPGL